MILTVFSCWSFRHGKAFYRGKNSLQESFTVAGLLRRAHHIMAAIQKTARSFKELNASQQIKYVSIPKHSKTFLFNLFDCGLSTNRLTITLPSLDRNATTTPISCQSRVHLWHFRCNVFQNSPQDSTNSITYCTPIKGPDNPTRQLLPIVSTKCCSGDEERRKDKRGGRGTRSKTKLCVTKLYVKDGV